MKIYLLRHGVTDWNKIGRIQGHTDIPLNEEGVEQIQTAGEYLRRTGEDIYAIISSPLVRAKKSAEIVADIIAYKKDIIIEPGFMERSFGSGEGLTKAERAEKFKDKAYPGIEPVDELCRRAESAMMKYAGLYFDRTILIVGHGSILKAVMVSVTKGEFSYRENEMWEVFGTGEFGLLEYDGENFAIVSSRISPAEEIMFEKKELT